MIDTKRWGVALKKNVTKTFANQTWHDSVVDLSSAKTFRTFETRAEARNFKKTVKNPAVIVDRLDMVAVR